MKRKFLIAIIDFTLIIMASLPVKSDWSAPVQISNASFGANNAKGVTDSEGMLHLFWEDHQRFDDSKSDYSAKEALMYAYKENGAWSNPVPIIDWSQDGEDFAAWAVTVDKKDTLHLVRAKKIATRQSRDAPQYVVKKNQLLYYTKPKGNNWSGPAVIFDSDHYRFNKYWSTELGGCYGSFSHIFIFDGENYRLGEFQQIELVADSEGVLHLVADFSYHQKTDIYYQEIRSKIEYMRKDKNGKWLKYSSTAIESCPSKIHALNLIIDKEDTLHLAWNEWPFGCWKYVSKPKSAKRSSSQVGDIAYFTMFNRDGDREVAPPFKMVMDSKKTLHFFWTHHHLQPLNAYDIFYAFKPKGGEISKKINISQTPGYFEFSIGCQVAIDQDDTLHLVWLQFIPVWEKGRLFPTVFFIDGKFVDAKEVLPDEFPAWKREINENGWPNVQKVEPWYIYKRQGSKWSEPVNIAGEMSEQYLFQPCQIIADNCNIHVIFEAPIFELDAEVDGEIFYAVRDFNTLRSIPSPIKKGDVNGDGVVDISDLVLVGQHFGEEIPTETNPNPDVNRDGVVDISDLVLVSKHFGETVSAAPARDVWKVDAENLTLLKQMHQQLEQIPQKDADILRTMELLRRLIALAEQAIVPAETAVLQNYPNPFNPETWIPFRLAEPGKVTIEIYSAAGQLVRMLEIGRKSAGNYLTKRKAAHWDGRNEKGEKVASGVYFYTLRAGDFSATRRMVIVK